MEQPIDTDSKIESMEQPIDTDSKMELEVLQAPWWAVLLEGIIAIVIGLFLLYEPVVTTILLIQILAIFWLAGGIVSVIGALIFPENRLWKLLSGILGIIAGVLILMYPIFSPFIVLTFLIIFIGAWAIVNGAVKLAWALKGGGWGMGILGVLTIILGLLLLTNSLVGALFLPWMFGFFLIIGGIGAVIWGNKNENLKKDFFKTKIRRQEYGKTYWCYYFDLCGCIAGIFKRYCNATVSWTVTLSRASEHSYFQPMVCPVVRLARLYMGLAGSDALAGRSTGLDVFGCYYGIQSVRGFCAAGYRRFMV